MSADKRKIQRLEEELEAAETGKKKAERSNQRLERDLKELQEKYDTLEKTSKTQQWGAKKIEQILDNKSLERNVSSLDTELEGLRKELKEAKDKIFELQRTNRETLRLDVDSSVIKREYENQIEELKRNFESERQQTNIDMESLKEELEKYKTKSNTRNVSRGFVSRGGSTGTAAGSTAGKPNDIRVKDLRASNNSNSSSSTSSFYKNGTDEVRIAELTKELKELRVKYESQEESLLAQSKQHEKELGELQQKYKDLNLLKERSDKKYIRFEDESRRLTGVLEKETKAKWDLEKDKLRLERELRDAQRLVCNVILLFVIVYDNYYY